MNNHIDFSTKRIVSVSVKEVIEVKTMIGDGNEENPVREQIQYWTVDGKLIASSFFD